jgi:hypothetical protein
MTRPPLPALWRSLIVPVTVAAVVFLLSIAAALAQDAREGIPDISAYYESLRQPDNPYASCCGEGDAYYADKVEPCSVVDGSDCAMVAIITDERPDTVTLPNGRTITRAHLLVGTRVAIPRSKLRRPAIVNPTDHNVVFVGGGVTVLCWEPVAMI